MPKAKAARFSRRKSHKSDVPKERDDDEANMAFEEFKGLAKIPKLTIMGQNKKYKMVLEPGDYARFFNVTLEGRTDSVDPSEYWVGEIKEVRRAKAGLDSWVHVKWLWAPDEIKALNIKPDLSHMGEYERVLCHAQHKSETVVHSDTIEGPTKVYMWDEHVKRIPEADAFYIRSTFNYSLKTLKYLNKDSECACVQCGLLYNPDESHKAPLRYCATCRVWCHTSCGKATDRRLIKSKEFTNPQHHAKGLLLSGPTSDPVKPGPKSAKAHSVADRAKNINLGPLTKRIPKGLQTNLIALAQMRIVRPLPGNIAGNKSYVLRAREWVCEARTAGGLSRDRVKELEEWFEDLTREIGIEELLAPDEREEAKRSALFTCNECGYPV